ncbi:MAG: FAD-dependent oxidoreductase [Armatimonadetes bacterium]|nr:FAD-dependent oxidoreductase [Armatimonadota bacterium]MBS1729038.1 FAD-dependent oxidoreductase [Armatimonadota bacterium]
MGNRLSRDVVVIGAGIIGLCSAYYAAEKGFKVTVVDQNPEGADSCSTGNAGMIVPSHFVPLAAPGMVGMGLRMMLNPKSPFAFRIPPSAEQVAWSISFMRHANAKHVADSETILRDLNLTSRKLYECLAEDLGIGYQLVKRGLLMLCRKQETLDAEAHLAERAQQIGVGASIHDLDGLKKLDPDVTMDVIGGVLCEDDCHLTPQNLLAALRTKLKESGATFLFNEAVTAIEPKADKTEVKTKSGKTLSADQVVIAGGVFSKDLAQKLGLKLPMMAGKGYSMTLANPVETPQLCSLLIEARVAVTPMQNGVRFGGTMELGEPSNEINRNRVQGIIDSIPQYFPKFKPADFENQPVWFGFRPCSPDGLPYVGRITRHPNVIVATGHSMMGLSLGPVTGMLVAEILGNEALSLPIDQLNPNRYA